MLRNIRLFLTLFLLIFGTSCVQRGGSLFEDVLSEVRRDRNLREEKRSDPRKQSGMCGRGSGDICEDNRDCEDICEDIFSKRSEREDCYELPEDLVEDFEDILESVEEGDIDSVDETTLECLLDISVDEFVDIVQDDLSSGDAKDILYDISQNDDLASIFSEEDNRFEILEALLEEAVGNSLEDQIGETIEDSKGFLWLVSESNEEAFKYLEDYVDEKCDSTDCPGEDEEPLNGFCKAILRHIRGGDLEEFIDEAEVFQDEYEDEVEDQDYEYKYDRDEDDDPRNFKSFCEDLIEDRVNPPTPPPTNPPVNPPTNPPTPPPTTNPPTTNPPPQNPVSFTCNHIRGRLFSEQCSHPNPNDVTSLTINSRGGAILPGDFRNFNNIKNIFIRGEVKLFHLTFSLHLSNSLTSVFITGSGLDSFRISPLSSTSVLPSRIFEGLRLLEFVDLSGNSFSRDEQEEIRASIIQASDVRDVDVQF